MQSLKTYLIMAILIAAATVQAGGTEQDWANLGAYRSKNSSLGLPAVAERRIVFMGDSITEFWQGLEQGAASPNRHVNRGISGQTTPQMLLRFRPDVIDLKPWAVVILAGTNDIAGNTGPATVAEIAGNIFTMAELARAHGIKVIIASVLPAARYPWQPEARPAAEILQLNKLLKGFAASHRFTYLDYYAAMVDEQMGLPLVYSDDGVHPNVAGYAMMRKLAMVSIKSVVDKSRFRH